MLKSAVDFVKCDNASSLKNLINNGLDVHSNVPLLAAKWGALESLKALSSIGKLPDDCIVYAAWSNRIEVVKWLCSTRNDASATSACATAASKGYADCLRVLVEYGAIPDSCSMRNAVRGGHDECVEFLDGCGLGIDVHDLTYAAGRGFSSTVVLADRLFSQRDSAVVLAALRQNQCETVETLLRAGYDADMECVLCAVSFPGCLRCLIALAEHDAAIAYDEALLAAAADMKSGCYQFLAFGKMPIECQFDMEI